MNGEEDKEFKEQPHSVAVKSTSKGLFYWDIKIYFSEYYNSEEIAQQIKSIHDRLLKEYKGINVYEGGN